MALDEALDVEHPALRLYAWDPPGLSLGYFQRANDISPELLRDLGAVLVRRVTGGGAICHTSELTFSLVAPPSFPLFKSTVEASYHTIHGAIGAGLSRLGIEVEPLGARPASSDSGRHREAVCFHKASGFDLVAQGRKLVGSAQRRRKDRVLHHGSIPLGRNPLATQAACLQDLLGEIPPLAVLLDAVTQGFRETLCVEFEVAEPTPEEWTRAQHLVDTRFGTDEWNRRV